MGPFKHLTRVLLCARRKRLSRLIAAKDIGSQVVARNLLSSDVLESGPVLGGDQVTLTEPLGHGLLADGGAGHERSDALGQSRLAAGDFDGLFKRDNVRFLHEHPKYTTYVVSVNNLSRVQENNLSCTVLYMPAHAKKRLPVTIEQPNGDGVAVIRGADGLTLGERLQRCMLTKSRKMGRRYTQKNLIADATRAAMRPPDDEVITQQGLSLILKNKRFESGATPALAAALEVEALWLQYGAGPASYLESLTSQAK